MQRIGRVLYKIGIEYAKFFGLASRSGRFHSQLPSEYQVRITPLSDKLDHIDQEVLTNLINSYRLLGYPTKVLPLNTEKELERPLWVVEVYTRGLLLEQITHYWSPIGSCKRIDDADEKLTSSEEIVVDTTP